MSRSATVSLTRELGFAIIRRQRWLPPERNLELMKAIEGATYDSKRKINYATFDKVPGILQRLREAEFSVECAPDLMTALSDHETRTWIDIRAAKERAAKVDEDLRKIRDRITGKPLYLFPFQHTGITWLATRYGGILGDEQGLGKAGPVTEPVLTPEGWRPIGQIRVGDRVFGADGRPTRVTGVFPQGRQTIYRIEMNDGAWTRCTDEHLWEVREREVPLKEWEVVSLKEIVRRGASRFELPILPRTTEIEQALGPSSPDLASCDVRRRFARVVMVGEEECVCIRVEDPRSLYVTRDCILTHNTITTLAALPAGARVVVVCPSVVKGVWRREIREKRPHLKVRALEGRAAFKSWPAPGEVQILNPEILPETHTKDCLARRKDKKTTIPGRHSFECETARRSWVTGAVLEAQPRRAIEAMKCQGCLTVAAEAKRCEGCLPITEEVPEDVVLVYDEAHMFKNLKAQRTIKARALARGVRRKGGRVWLLTGTPILNKPEEMWALSDVALVAEEAFRSYDGFVKLFGGRPADNGFGWVWEGDPETAEVAERIERIMLRRRRVDVMPELPRKTFQIVPVEVDKEALAACDAALAEYGGVDKIAEMLDKKIEFKTISRIREALAKAKIPAMLEFVDEYEASGEPVVVASAHRAPIDALASRPGWKVITGDISAEERTEIEDAFQRGELRGVGCTIQSAGVGITLTRACHMIRVDSAWSPGINAQMDDRICRIGQTRPVLIRILAANHPLDERVEETLARKQHLIEQTIDAAAQRPESEGGQA